MPILGHKNSIKDQINFGNSYLRIRVLLGSYGFFYVERDLMEAKHVQTVAIPSVKYDLKPENKGFATWPSPSYG